MFNKKINLGNFMDLEFGALFIIQLCNAFQMTILAISTYLIAVKFMLSPQIIIPLAVGIYYLPFLFFSSLAGEVADKVDKAKSLKIISLTSIFIILGIAFSLCFNHILIYAFFIFLLGINAAFFGPLKHSLIDVIFQKREISEANGKLMLAFILGPIFGSLFVYFQSNLKFICAALLLSAMITFICSLLMKAPAPFAKEQIQYNGLKNSGRFFMFLRKKGDVFLSILGISWFWFIVTTFLSQFPAMFSGGVGGNGKIVLIFLLDFLLGAVIGGYICQKSLKGITQFTYVPLAAINFTVFLIDLFFISRQLDFHAVTYELSTFFYTFSNLRFVYDLFMIAVYGALFIIPLYSALQEGVKKKFNGRIIAANNMLNAVFILLSVPLTLITASGRLVFSEVIITIILVNILVVFYTIKLLPTALPISTVKFFLKLFYRVEVEGLDNFVKAGKKVMIISNHTSFLDAVLLVVYLPGTLTFAIASQMAEQFWVKPWLKLVDACKVDPTNPLAAKTLVNVLNQKKRVVIFPEGRLTLTGALMKINEGPGLIADKANAVILPIRIKGADLSPFTRIRGKYNKQWFPKITLKILEPRKFEIDDKIKGRERRQIIGEKIYEIMVAMMFSSSNYNKTITQGVINAGKKNGWKSEIANDIEIKPINYRQLIRKNIALGSLMTKQIAKDEMVGLMMPNNIKMMVLFFSLQMYERITVILNYTVSKENFIAACNLAKIKKIYTSSKFVEQAKLEDLIKELQAQKIEIIYYEELITKITFWQRIKGYIGSHFPQISYNLIAGQGLHPGDKPAVVFCSFSGEGGKTKGIVLSHANFHANRYQLLSKIDLTGRDKIFNCLPIFNSFGFTLGMMLPVLAGIKVFLYPTPMHYGIIPVLVYETNSTILLSSSKHLAGYAENAHPYDFYSIRYILTEGEKVSEIVRENWAHQFGTRILETYNSTEASPVISLNTPMQNKMGTVGKLLTNMTSQLEEIPGMTEGKHLIVSGPNIMYGSLTAKTPGEIVINKEQNFNTHDIVKMDDAGFITIIGRESRKTIIDGQLVLLNAVEECILRLWPNNNHVVVTYSDTTLGLQLALATNYEKARLDTLAEYIKLRHLPEVFIPKKLKIMSELPLAGMDKIDYAKIEKEI